MDAPPLVALLQDAFPGVPFAPVPGIDPQTTMYVPREALAEVMPGLRDRRELRFAFLAELTAIDFHPAEPRYEIVYVLVSIEHKLRLRLKVRVPGVDPWMPTMTGVWPAANWLEREVWDLFGIAFEGHPDPRRLLMPEDWEGHPLRKDYPVQIRLKPRSTEALQVTEAEFRASLTKDRLVRGQD